MFIIFLVILFASTSWGEGLALIITDMQPKFVTRHDLQNLNKNSEKFKNVIQQQIKLIEAAKNNEVPILITEYRRDNFTSDTDYRLIQAIGDYDRALVVQKNTDDLFSEINILSIFKIRVFLNEWDTKELIVVGANGGACVRLTMAGAVKNGFQVHTYSHGVIDFNHRDFIYPYSYTYDAAVDEAGRSYSINQFKSFHEVLQKLREP